MKVHIHLLELQQYNISRVWIRGEANILADAPSRAPADEKVVHCHGSFHSAHCIKCHAEENMSRVRPKVKAKFNIALFLSLISNPKLLSTEAIPPGGAFL